jgi:nitric oxide synthase-interacting protein
MTRHGKNNTASACYTYHERQSDAKTGGYGTLKTRLGKDSVKDFDACCLTLQPCKYPVITPDGYLFDKEAILQYILTKKKENARKAKEFEKNKKKNEKELQELAAAEERSKAEAFANHQKIIGSSSDKSEASSSNTVSNMTQGRDKLLPSFWIPSETPASSKSLDLKKPETTVYCPMSGKPLKMSSLFDVIFTPIDKVATGDPNRKERYMCPVTHDILSNSTPCTFLKTSGSVVTSECVEKLIKKDMMDPVNGMKLKETDLIPVQRGGTGYSSTNQLEASITKPSIQA